MKCPGTGHRWWLQNIVSVPWTARSKVATCMLCDSCLNRRKGESRCYQGTVPWGRWALPTFRVLPGRSALDPEGLPCAAAVSEAPAFRDLARTVLQALVSAGRPPHRLGLRGPLPLGSHTSGAGEDTIFQTDLLTAPTRTDGQTHTGRQQEKSLWTEHWHPSSALS